MEGAVVVLGDTFVDVVVSGVQALPREWGQVPLPDKYLLLLLFFL